MPEDFNFSLEEIGNKADQISSELQELEDLLRKGGIELENNICLSKKGKSVVFPKGYVRKVSEGSPTKVCTFRDRHHYLHFSGQTPLFTFQ